MLTWRTEPFSIWDQHERRPQAGRVVSSIARVTQQDLRKRTQKHTEDVMLEAEGRALYCGFSYIFK